MACCRILTLGAIRNANSTTVSNHVHKAGNFKFFCSFLIFILKREIKKKTGSDEISHRIPYFLCISSYRIAPNYIYRGLHPRGCFQSQLFMFVSQKYLPFPYLTAHTKIKSKWIRNLNEKENLFSKTLPSAHIERRVLDPYQVTLSMKS